MQLNKIREGLDIFARYYDKPDGYHTSAEHDVLYVYATDRPLSESDLARVIELGWFQEVELEEEDGDFHASDYDPEEGWTAFT